MSPVISALLDRGLHTAYYMADLRAMPSLLDVGILSFREIQRRGIASFSLSNKSVQEKRSQKLVFNATPLHDFVPLYFGWFTLMQRAVESRSQEESDRLVFTEVSLRSLAPVVKCVAFTDENAATERARFSNDPKELDWIDWTAIRLTHANVKPKRRSRPPAPELLIMREVPANCMARIVCEAKLVLGNVHRSR
jgi:hypothetical protein